MPVWLDDFLWTYQNLINALGINGLLALSMYVVLAVGQLSLGQAAFMGLGAYSSALMTMKLHLPFLIVLPASCLVPVAFALAIAVLDGTTAQLAFCMSTPDRELSSFSRYQVCAEIVAQAIKGQATVLLGDGHLLLKPGLRQFAKAVGFLPERVVIAGSARRGLS